MQNYPRQTQSPTMLSAEAVNVTHVKQRTPREREDHEDFPGIKHLVHRQI